MGSFPGHALPGSFFVLFSLWHICQLSVSYFASKRRNAKPFKSASYFPSGCCSGFPSESALKLLSCSVGILGEAVTGVDVHGNFVNIGNSQHIAMFFFFGLTGLIEILHFYRFHLPPKATYLASILAFVVEALLFTFHLHGRSEMDIQIHKMLNLVVLATVACLFVEMWKRHLVVAALGRAYLVLLQGLWFWQVGFILYPPMGMEEWDQSSHEQMMLLTVVFAAQAAFALLLTMAIWFSVSCSFGSCRKPRRELYDSLAMRVLQGGRREPAEEERVLVDVDGHSDDEEELFLAKSG